MVKSIFAFSLHVWSIFLFGQSNPYICFSDLQSGPNTGNTDAYAPAAMNGGAIVTIWGKKFGKNIAKASVWIGGKKAIIYTWDRAVTPADLYSRLEMDKIEFMIPSTVNKGNNLIQVINSNGDTSNSIPFRVREGRIYFVMKQGNDDTGDGTWQKPWATLDNTKGTGALEKMKPGDIVYVGDKVTHTALAGDRAAIDFSAPGSQDLPKAIIGYPGAIASIGDSSIQKSYSLWVSGIGPSFNWVVSKMNLIAAHEACVMYHGFRVTGCKITAPNGNGPTGAVAGQGNNLYFLGNELTHIGFHGTSKLYHPIYFQSAESCNGPRLPLETDREIAWNYIHDNLSYDAINIYRECGASAYMTNHRIHDNFILNQTGCGIRIGDYVVGENWVYNNIIINAGLGPDPPNEEAMHVPVFIHAGWDDTSTLIHFYNNTIYGGGYLKGASWSSSMVGFGYNHPFQLDFRNNIIVSMIPQIKYLNDRLDSPESGVFNNIWWGAGNAPGWDFNPSTADPLFIDPQNYNFNLGSKSKAIDAGYPVPSSPKLPLPERDINCNLRLRAVDLGAMEFTGPGSVPLKEGREHVFKIHPNPTMEFVQIQGYKMNKPIETLSIEWIDLQGKKFAVDKLSVSKNEVLHLRLPGNLVPGVYILKINGDSHKVIKI